MMKKKVCIYNNNKLIFDLTGTAARIIIIIIFCILFFLRVLRGAPATSVFGGASGGRRAQRIAAWLTQHYIRWQPTGGGGGQGQRDLLAAPSHGLPVRRRLVAGFRYHYINIGI